MKDQTPVPSAGNGLLGRRYFLQASLKVAAGTSAGLLSAHATAQRRDPWMQTSGSGMSEVGTPSRFETALKRTGIGSQPGTVGSGASRTPLEALDGIITPSRLHFERHHNGIPDIDPAQHRLYIHGLVDRPKAFDVEALDRYSKVSRIQFLECSGNSAALIAPQPVQANCSTIHGLISGSEWGGVPLAALLEEVGVQRNARWIVAEGADAAAMSRSIPLHKVLDDAIVALYQNGEPLQPANGYPMRLFLPGWEGNASVKWLRSIRVTDQPAMTKDETSKYSDLRDDGIAELFTFPMGVKSVITSPSPGLTLHERGVYQVSGLAWSGVAAIRRVEVSADGGTSWADAVLDEHVLAKSLTRFRTAWQYSGAPALLLSRATDQAGNVQPTRAALMQGRAASSIYHCNAITAWQIDADGEAHHVYV